MHENDWSYGGYCRKCGMLCAAVVDNPDMLLRTAHGVSQMIENGLIVKRVTDDVIRAEFSSDCRCEADGD